MSGEDWSHTTWRQQAERDNAVRLTEHPRRVRDGHVESHFLKANSPDGTRAIWIKHTLLVPRQGSAVAELWAIAFRGAEQLARKQTFSLGEVRFDATPFGIATPGGELMVDRAHGSLPDLAWELSFESRAPAFRPFPLGLMYRGAFPRSKSLTPAPDARFAGWFEAFGERWCLDGWRGAQGHNWGASHAHAYAWVHANALSREPGGPPLEHAWVEALSGRVRVGDRTTPYLSVAGLSLEGKVLRFDGPRAMFARRVSVDFQSYQFELRRPGARLIAEFRAAPSQQAGLRYLDPDGSQLACLNSKLARGTLTLEQRGRRQVLHTRQAALEIGTRDPAHGVELLV